MGIQRGAGWRSARWRNGNGATATTVPPVLPDAPTPTYSPATPPRVLGGRVRRGAARALAAFSPTGSLGAAALRIEDRFVWPWQGVDFSFPFIAFLTYVFVTTSYLLPLGQVAMVAAIAGVTMSSRDRWRLPAPFALFVVFVALVGLLYRSSQYSAVVWTPYQDLVKVTIVALVGIAVLNTRERIRFFIFFYLGAFALFPIRGAVFNWFLYRATTQGRVGWNNVFENPNDLAGLLIFPMGLAIAVIFSERQKIVRLLALAGVVAIPMVMFMTQSRGAIIAITGGAFTYFLMQGKGRFKSVLALGAIALVLAVFAPKEVWGRLGNLKSATESGEMTKANDSRSAEQRLEIWKVALTVTSEFPYTGVGWSAYPTAHMYTSGRAKFKPLARGARDAHSTYLTLMAETGVPGFLLWATMVFIIVTTALRAIVRMKPHIPAYSQQIKMILLALVSFGLAGVFGTFQGLAFTYLHLVTLYALSTVALREVDQLESGGASSVSRRSRG